MNDHIYLAHYGIKGMRWGVRRFRNEDGTLTEAGRKRYSKQLMKTVTGSSSWKEAKNRAKSVIGDTRSDTTKQLRAEVKRLAKSTFTKDGIDLDETPEYWDAAHAAAQRYIDNELRRIPNEYPEGSRARKRLEDYAYIEYGHPAGYKAARKAYPEVAKAQRQFNLAVTDYLKSLNVDVDKLVSDNENLSLTRSMLLPDVHPSNATTRELVYQILSEYD